jgi:hypothetical protein
MFEDQISSTLGTRILYLRNKSRLLYGTRLHPRNKSRQHREQERTNFVYLRNKCLIYLGNNKLRLRKTLINTVNKKLRPGNKSRLLMEQKHSVGRTHLIYSSKKNIAPEEQISYTLEQEYVVRGTKNIASGEQISSTQGTKKLCSRIKSRVPWEQEYCV